MAIYHCSISNVSRAKGSSSCATLAYISGKKVHDDRLNATYSYSREERVLEVGTILPNFAPVEYANAEILFNAIEKHETADNARTAKKIEVALPKELPIEEQKRIIENYIRNNLTKEGYCATYAIHDGNDRGNYHAHILVANRPINAKGEWGCKRKMAYALDDNGDRIPLLTKAGQQKTDSHGRKQWKRVNVEQNQLDTRDFLCQLRKEWAAEVNKQLSPEHQIDHRSNIEQGIEDKPTIHEGYAARAIEASGEVSERCQMNREIRAENKQRREIRVELAAALAQDKILEKKEHELHERLRNIRRGNNDNPIGRTPERKRQVETRDYAAELLAYRREATEREIARISKEREAAARAEREATERKKQLAAGSAKRQQQSRQPTKTATGSHEHTITR